MNMHTLEDSNYAVKVDFINRLKGGVIMDVTTPEQAKIAEGAGAVAVMALERVPADIRATGGVARMADPVIVEAIKNAVRIPVMAKARIGHFVEAQVLDRAAVLMALAPRLEIFVPGVDPSWLAPLSAAGAIVHGRPVSMAEAMSRTRLLIHQGSK